MARSTSPKENVELHCVSGPGGVAEGSGQRNVEQASEETAVDANAQSLPDCDRGKAAWRMLLAAFVFEALLWGSCNRC